MNLSRKVKTGFQQLSLLEVLLSNLLLSEGQAGTA
jgi:hypothetical protein